MQFHDNPFLFASFSGSFYNTFLFDVESAASVAGHLSESQSWHLCRALRNALIIHPTTPETRTIPIPPAEHLHAFVWLRGHARSVAQGRRRRRRRRRDAATHKTRTSDRDDATAPTSSWHPCHPRDTYRVAANSALSRSRPLAAVSFSAVGSENERIRLELRATPFCKGTRFVTILST